MEKEQKNKIKNKIAKIHILWISNAHWKFQTPRISIRYLRTTLEVFNRNQNHTLFR